MTAAFNPVCNPSNICIRAVETNIVQLNLETPRTGFVHQLQGSIARQCGFHGKALPTIKKIVLLLHRLSTSGNACHLDVLRIYLPRDSVRVDNGTITWKPRTGQGRFPCTVGSCDDDKSRSVVAHALCRTP